MAARAFPGTFIGALFTTRLRLRRAGRLLLGGNVVIGVALIAVVVLGSLPAMMAAGFVAGFAESVIVITYITLRAALSPDELIGRIGGTARTISLGLQPIGFVTAGLLIDAVGGGITLATLGIALVAMSGLIALSRPFRGADAQTPESSA